MNDTNRHNLAPEEREEILERVSAELALHHEILFAFSHGSFMESGPFRDLDIAVFLRPDFLSSCGFRYEMQMEAQIEKALKDHFAVDLRVLNNAKLSFQYHALRGRLLFDRDPDMRIAFTRQVAARYLDIAPILKHHTREAFARESGS